MNRLLEQHGTVIRSIEKRTVMINPCPRGKPALIGPVCYYFFPASLDEVHDAMVCPSLGSFTKRALSVIDKSGTTAYPGHELSAGAGVDIPPPIIMNGEQFLCSAPHGPKLVRKKLVAGRVTGKIIEENIMRC